MRVVCTLLARPGVLMPTRPTATNLPHAGCLRLPGVFAPVHSALPTGPPGLQVLGGAGPAVASVPLAVLWAGGSAFVLLRR